MGNNKGLLATKRRKLILETELNHLEPTHRAKLTIITSNEQLTTAVTNSIL